MKISVKQIAFVASETNAAFDEQVRDIAASMKEQGQLQPISVRSANSSSSKYTLNFGEKRILAAKLNGWEEVDAQIEELTPRQADIKRVHENLKRFNLPWYEQALLTEKLHTLRQEEHGTAKTGRPKIEEKDKKGWSVRDTAEELGAALGTISEDINLARAVRANPSLRAVQDRKTAIRLVKVEARREFARIDAVAPKSIDVDEVYLEISTSILGQLPDCSIDSCWTDPPWISFFDPKLARDERTFPVFKEVYRVLKYDSFCYIVVGFDDFHHYVGFDKVDEKGVASHVFGELERVGFAASRTPVIWHKHNTMSRRGVKGWEYDRDFELVIVAVKGTPALTSSTRLSGVKGCPVVPPRNLIHPHEKPVALVTSFLEDATFPDNVILDPFGGSGVLAEACLRNKRHFIVIERDKDTYDKIVQRVDRVTQEVEKIRIEEEKEAIKKIRAQAALIVAPVQKPPIPEDSK